MGARFSRNGHAHGHGARSFITPYESLTHVQQTNTPLRVSTVTAKRRQGRKQRLPLFLNSDRLNGFVYVVSVLEHYSDQDCLVLLGCALRDVIAARIRALQQIDTQSSFTLSGR